MMRNMFCWLVCIVLLMSAACGRQPELSKPGPQDTVLAFGDSLTYGTGAEKEESYPAVLERITGIQVVNAGVPGEVTRDGRKRLPGLLDEYNPALVLLCLGGNDMLGKTDDAIIAENLVAMIRLCQRRNIEVLLIGVPKPKLIGMKTAKFYYEVADKTGVPLEDRVLTRILKDNRYKSDRIHPNAAGYTMMAEAVAERLK